LKKNRIKREKREEKKRRKEKLDLLVKYIFLLNLLKELIYIYIYIIHYMVYYKCEICDFITDKTTNYQRHLKTNKHIRKLKEKEKMDAKISKIASKDAQSPKLTSSVQNFDYNLKGQKNIFLKRLKEGLENQYICLYCQKEYSTNSSWNKHMKKCKNKKEVIKGGLYIMWNHKMIDEEGNMFYKIGKSSCRKEKICSYAYEYKIKSSEIKFLYEVNVKNEKFAEKIVFNILEEYRKDKFGELFTVPFEIAKDVLNIVSEIILEFKCDKLTKLSQDKIDILIKYEEIDSYDNDSINVENLSNIHTNYCDINEEYNTFLYLKNIINGEYDIIETIKKKKFEIKKKREYKCTYCQKSFKYSTNYYRHLKHRCKIKLDEEIDSTSTEKLKKELEIAMKKIEILEQNMKNNGNTTINNGNIADKMINNNQNITIQILNDMKPKDLLNKYYHNTPSLNELMEYLQKEYITANDAHQIESVENQEIQDPKTRLNFIAYAVNDIIINSTRRLIESKDLKDAYCNSCLFLNDGSMRKYLEKDISWDNSGDINKIQKLVVEICNQTIRKHKVFRHRPPSKEEEISLAKQILKMNNWSKSKKDLIQNVKTETDIDYNTNSLIL